MKRGWKVFATGFLLILFSVEPSAWADNEDRILDLLLKKKIITQEEYDQIKKEAQAPSVSTEEAKPGEKKPAPIGSYKDLETKRGGIENLRKEGYRNVWTDLDTLLKHSERLSIGLVALKAQYNADNTDRMPGTADENGFRIRAAELYVTGRLMPWSTYYMEVDFARQSEITLNSMYMDFYTKDMEHVKGLYPYLSQIRVGQFREPFGIEQGTSQGLLDFINRAYYTDLSLVGGVDTQAGDPSLNPFGKTNATGFMQQLDIGVQLIHKAPQLPLEPELQWAGINGAGRNFNDNNADKDLTGRLILTPTEGMKLYFAGYTGTAFFTGAASGPLQPNTDVKKTSQGLRDTNTPPHVPELKLQGE